MTATFTWTKYKGLTEAIVVSLDMRSSSWIVDELEADGNLARLGGFWGEIKHFLGNELQKRRGLKFTPYKFIGDSWILLFLPDTPGRALLGGLRDLCMFYDREFETLLPHVSHAPPRSGIAFGVDAGPLLPTTIFANDEYLGRCINIAARLQTCAKEGPERFPMIVSQSTYGAYFGDAGFRNSPAAFELKGFRNGSNFACVRVYLS
jgi:hypothetical protein